MLFRQKTNDKKGCQDKDEKDSSMVSENLDSDSAGHSYLEFKHGTSLTSYNQHGNLESVKLQGMANAMRS
jgi:hypothetical protein